MTTLRQPRSHTDSNVSDSGRTVAGLVRTHDVIQGLDDLEHLFSFSNFPVFLGCTDAAPETDQVFDLSFAISRHSGCVQLDRLVPLDVLYAANHAPVVGALWEAHHREFARFVADFKPQSVLEIGGAHGMLCRNFRALQAEVRWTIVEPNPIPVEGLDAHFIPTFFDSSFQSDERYDLVVHSHTLEHIYEPRRFIADIAKLSQPGDIHCFSAPDLQAWLERHYTNALNFEHTYLLNDAYISGMLAEQGFRVLRREGFGDRHSVFYATVREAAGSGVRQIYPADLYERNKALILGYRDELHAQVAKLNAQLQTEQGPVFLFGAHVFSQTLLALGLDTSRIECLLDNAKVKQGQRLYGTGLQVSDPSVLAGLTRPVVIIRAGAYEGEIKAAILAQHNAQTLFI
jgi:hypothetical protein